MIIIPLCIAGNATTCTSCIASGVFIGEYDDAPELDYQFNLINNNKYSVNPDINIKDLQTEYEHIIFEEM